MGIGGQFHACSDGGKGFIDPTCSRNVILSGLSDLFQELGVNLHPKYVTFSRATYTFPLLLEITSFLKDSQNILTAALYNFGSDDENLKFCKALTAVIEKNKTLKHLRISGNPVGLVCINLLAESLAKKPSIKLSLRNEYEDALLKEAIEDKTKLAEKAALVLEVMAKDVGELTFQYAGWSKEKKLTVAPDKKSKRRDEHKRASKFI